MEEQKTATQVEVERDPLTLSTRQFHARVWISFCCAFFLIPAVAIGTSILLGVLSFADIVISAPAIIGAYFAVSGAVGAFLTLRFLRAYAPYDETSLSKVKSYRALSHLPLRVVIASIVYGIGAAVAFNESVFGSAFPASTGFVSARLYAFVVPAVCIVSMLVFAYVNELIGRYFAPRGIVANMLPAWVKAAAFTIVLPVLIESILVLYIVERTGELETNTALLWTTLVIATVLSGYLSIRSTRQGMAPLLRMVNATNWQTETNNRPCSLDEYGLFTEKWAALLQRKIEAADLARKSEERYHALVDEVGDWIWETDWRGVIVYASPQVEKLLGMSPTAMTGNDLLSFVDPAHRKRLRRLALRSSRKATRVDKVEAPFIHADGHTIVLEITAVPLTAGPKQLIGYRGIARDVSARAELEKAARDAQALYQDATQREHLIVGAMSEGLALLDKHGAFLDVNSAFLAMIGYSRDELEKMAVSALAADGHQDALGDYLARLFETGGGKIEAELTRKDGTPLAAAIEGRVVEEKQNAYLLFSDQTEQRNFEQKFMQLTAELEGEKEQRDAAALALKEATTKIAEQERGLDELREERNGIEERLKKAESEHESLRDELARSSEEKDSLGKQLTESAAEKSAIGEDLRRSEETVASLQADLAHSSQQVATLEQRLRESEQIQAALGNELQSSKEHSASLAARLDEQENSLAEKDKEIAQLQAALAKIEEQRREVEDSLAKSDARRLELESSLQRVETEVAQIETKFQASESQNAGFKGEIERLAEENQQLTQRIEAEVSRGAKRDEEFDALKKEKAELVSSMDELAREKSQIQGSLDSLSSAKSEIETQWAATKTALEETAAERKQLEVEFEKLRKEKAAVEKALKLSREDYKEVQATLRRIEMDRIGVQAALTRSEQLYMWAAEFGHIGLWEWDIASDSVKASEEMCRMIGTDAAVNGVSYQEFLGFVHEVDRERLAERIETALQGDEDTLDLTHRIAAGVADVRWVKQRIVVDRRDEKPFKVMGTLVEVTEKKRLESDLERFATMVRLAPELLGIADRDGKLVFLNDAGRRYAGVAHDASLDSMRLNQLFGGAARERFVDSVFPHVAQHGKWAGEVLVQEATTGRNKPASFAVIKIDDRDTKDAAYYVLVARDTSQRKRAEMELSRYRTKIQALESERRHNAALESRYGQGGGDIEQLLKTARAGDLRHPLGVVRPMLQTLRKGVTGGDPLLTKAVSDIERTMVRYDHVINELFELAQMPPLQSKPVALDQMLRNILGEQVKPEEIEIELQLGLGQLEVGVDEDRLCSAIIRIYENACQALTAGSQAGRTPKLRVTTRRGTNNRLEIEFLDNGPGIPAQVLANIFDPLFTTKPFGDGLGLPMAKQILEQHGGGIAVDSRPGAGTRFVLWLPAELSQRGKRHESNPAAVDEGSQHPVMG